jgi:hypothetical protein
MVAFFLHVVLDVFSPTGLHETLQSVKIKRFSPTGLHKYRCEQVLHETM